MAKRLTDASRFRLMGLRRLSAWDHECPDPMRGGAWFHARYLAQWPDSPSKPKPSAAADKLWKVRYDRDWC